jgi:hypothetical protein
MIGTRQLPNAERAVQRLRYACRPMTVCLAALANSGKSLVLACDSMLSAESFSSDRIADKMFVLTTPYQWWAMYAGDVVNVVPVIELAVKRLLNLSPATNTREIVEREILAAYQTVRGQLAADSVLSPVGLTWQAILQNAELHAGVAARLERVNLGCEFLIAGFDWNGDGYIFSIIHPGVIRNHNACGYESIGSGAYNALATLMHHSVNQQMELARVLYHVCESKFMAESADGVGKHTHVKVARGSGKMDAYELSEESITGIRFAWEKEGKPRVPRGFIEHLEEQLRKHPAGPLV